MRPRGACSRSPQHVVAPTGAAVARGRRSRRRGFRRPGRPSRDPGRRPDPAPPPAPDGPPLPVPRRNCAIPVEVVLSGAVWPRAPTATVSWPPNGLLGRHPVPVHACAGTNRTRDLPVTPPVRGSNAPAQLNSPHNTTATGIAQCRGMGRRGAGPEGRGACRSEGQAGAAAAAAALRLTAAARRLLAVDRRFAQSRKRLRVLRAPVARSLAAPVAARAAPAEPTVRAFPGSS